MITLQIITDPSNWDNSRLQVVGKVDALTGRTISPSATLIMAKDLPEPHLTIWHATVEALRSEGKGEWDIVQVDVFAPAPFSPVEEEGEEAQPPSPESEETDQFRDLTKMMPDSSESGTLSPEALEVLKATLYRQFSDGTCDSVIQIWDDPALIDLFNYLTTNPN